MFAGEGSFRGIGRLYGWLTRRGSYSAEIKVRAERRMGELLGETVERGGDRLVCFTGLFEA